MMRRGRFITLEGGEGAGKTTAMHTVRSWLAERGREVIVTREPGGTAAAERIRALLLDPDNGPLTPMSELLLMFAARQENLAGVIRPALARGTDIICDRFTDASRAYQGAGRQLGSEAVETLAGLVHPDLQPDLTLLLDVPVAVGMERIRGREGGPDRMEQSRPEFLERVRQAYLAQARLEPGRFVVIDAARGLEDVTAAIESALSERLT
ncbi:dTMP kinase [Wenzhouxiangella sp. EGI_FJ10305]|uniref:dTMP kinase n=1 Tax=Wenzhouxiangella sp. EGI_FJ10305 TaxID=3243768 RepID=UPI0035D64AA4